MADNNLFELKIIEPDGMFFEGEAEFLEFTSVEGQMGVYKNHIPL
ncbi:MAG: F0F1 ATP synthase subunit epsilon, partial [Tyzzerella sp.]|nr:F0F1 ATP synthase subunit epsilon [Tyzzerella sp.]